MKVKLEKEEIEIIRDTVRKFDKGAKIFIFGSRTDLSKRGEI